MSRKISFIAVAAAFLALVAVPAFAAKGGNGGGGNGGGGKNAGASGGSTGQLDPTIGISSQSAGSISFSVNTDANTGSPALNVATTCSDWFGATTYSADQPVVWSGSTLGFAGPFSPPSGAACVAWVHTPDSSTRLAQISYAAP
jgi:hypothetical protein